MPVATRVSTAAPKRRAANVTLPEHLVQAARSLNLNVSKACETGLRAEVEQAKQRRWLAENRAAIEAWNDYVETTGLPLAAFRPF